MIFKWLSMIKLTIAPLSLFTSSVDVLVIGAGPTGLGAAKRLNQIVRFSKPQFVSIPSSPELFELTYAA